MEPTSPVAPALQANSLPLSQPITYIKINLFYSFFSLFSPPKLRHIVFRKQFAYSFPILVTSFILLADLQLISIFNTNHHDAF